MIVTSSIFIFLITAIISFIGSIQLGPVNITVLRTAIQKNYKTAIFIGFGGALPEILYASIALKGTAFLEQFPMIIDGMMLLCIPAFILVGLYLIFKNSEIKKQSYYKVSTPKSVLNSIVIGFSIGFLNPMLLPFWIVVLSTYHKYNVMAIPNNIHNIVFVLGTAFGAFLLQYVIVVLLKKFNHKFEKPLRNYSNLVTAWMFILLGIFQLINYLNK